MPLRPALSRYGNWVPAPLLAGAITLTYAEVEQKLFANHQSTRLKTLGSVALLPSADARRLLGAALEHWDIQLRTGAARRLIGLDGLAAFETVTKLLESRRLLAKKTIRCLGRLDEPEVTRYLLGLRRRVTRALAGEIEKAVAKHSSSEAALLKWELAGDLKPRLRNSIEEVSQTRLSEFLGELSDKARKKILQHPRSIAYLQTRGLFANEEEAVGAGSEEKSDLPPSSAAPSSSSPGHTTPEAATSLEAPAKPWQAELGHGLVLSARQYGWIVTHWNDLDARGYRVFKVPKANGQERTIAAPVSVLKSMQRLILRVLTQSFALHDHCHGFRRGRSIRSNAEPHVGHEVVIGLDLKDFFPSITAGRVYGLFISLGFVEPDARLLTRLVTYCGVLPQGAPTSPAIANLICRHLDSRLVGLAQKADAAYTRYADDLTFSGSMQIRSLLPLIRSIIAEEGFTISEEKQHITQRGARQDVTGLTVNEKVSVPRAVRRRLRAVVHRASKGDQTRWEGKRIEMASIKGHIAFLHSVHPQEAAALLVKLKQAVAT